MKSKKKKKQGQDFIFVFKKLCCKRDEEETVENGKQVREKNKRGGK